MASGSGSGVSSSSSPTATLESPEFPDSHKPGPSQSKVVAGRRNPSMLRMVLEALQAKEQRQGTSVVAIKVYILQKYPTVDAARFKYLLKQALDTGMRRGLLTRPANSKARGATGSFRVTPGRATGAKQVGPKKPQQPKRNSANMAKMEKARPCLGSAQEKGSKRANHAKAKKAAPKSSQAIRVPPSANGFGGKTKVKGSGRRQGGHVHSMGESGVLAE
uniref:Histone H1.8 n=1 Tax=Jaculus jaculus TaxID=51337 RepID=A0A8C5NZQ5_JACJA